MAASRENPIIFYGLDYGKGSPWSPNPYKTRLYLNYKPKMKELRISPTSDTFPYYTMPVIVDPSSEPGGKPTYVAESFNIAIYLDDKYPAPKYPAIFPPWNAFSSNLIVAQYFPTIIGNVAAVLSPGIFRILDLRSMEYVKHTRGDSLRPLSEQQETIMWQGAHDSFAAMSKALDAEGEDGPYLGDQVSFVDFGLGGLLHLMEKVDPSRLEEVLKWQSGRWRNFWRGI
ncbi:hypothetical protein CTheo_8335 [Ceratobasidium theobromae]|uniref:GST N-terminal domain-containing protein n=1 Tax=Ceratobasidium theobromae TaxID=1582974 RepID=A0A5N5Q9X1_9AGAM|nr:hypothetical protein CTheo_8335 [Ceratobasidium theobromae]